MGSRHRIQTGKGPPSQEAHPEDDDTNFFGLSNPLKVFDLPPLKAPLELLSLNLKRTGLPRNEDHDTMTRRKYIENVKGKRDNTKHTSATINMRIQARGTSIRNTCLAFEDQSTSKADAAVVWIGEETAQMTFCSKSSSDDDRGWMLTMPIIKDRSRRGKTRQCVRKRIRRVMQRIARCDGRL